jgi:hypothetical protein
MAIRRRPPAPEAPAELAEFQPEEWESPGDERWWPSVERWKAARRVWLVEHPDNNALVDNLDLMVHEHRVHMNMLRWRSQELRRSGCASETG